MSHGERINEKAENMNKWLFGILTSVFIVSGLTLFRDRLGEIWANPEKTEIVAAKVEKQLETTEQIAKLVVEQQARQDKAEAVYNAQIQAIDRQIELIAEIKRGKR